MMLTPSWFPLLLLLSGVRWTFSKAQAEPSETPDQSFDETTDVPLSSSELEANQNETIDPTADQPEDPRPGCSYRQVLDYLNLTKDNELYSMSRPVKDHTTPTFVYLEMMIYAILDVREVDQTLISYVWILVDWTNEYVTWNSDKFCGITSVTIPNDILWHPDLTIEEMIEKDKAPPSPYLKIHSYQQVEYKNDQVIISTCEMHVFKFPFDIQNCNISFKSILHSDQELKIMVNKNNTQITEWSREVMKTQFEWLFLGMSVDTKTNNFYGYNQTSIVYTITMRRRCVLYVANFLLPILLLMALDLASFLIPDTGGEKLGFKVTVLLAVTVMQLILKDILPSSTDSVPLIVIYCIGIFSMMLLSLFETILVIYLMGKDSLSQDSDAEVESKRRSRDLKSSQSEHDSEQLNMDPPSTKEDSNKLISVSLSLEKVSEELEEINKKMSLLSDKKGEAKVGYWTRLSQRITRVFAFLYVGASSTFLVVIFFLWMT